MHKFMLYLHDHNTFLFSIILFGLYTFFGWFEARIYTVDKKIEDNKQKYYFTSIVSYILLFFLVQTDSNVLILRWVIVVIIFSVFRYKEDSPIITLVSLVLIQIYLLAITLLINSVVTLILQV
ncbi:hypothetical protein CI105_09120 [Candidatus Izimaplasma bacterium ZiA1]|nr:hypothetical protein CI105_09120 [Candidatus Izimaplasma bacterium ZiA1]